MEVKNLTPQNRRMLKAILAAKEAKAKQAA
jgi:hypothetical protein